MEVHLTAEQRSELIQLEKQIAHKKEAIRIRVILALDLGYSVSQVAEILLLDENTVRKWQQKYDKGQFFSDWLVEGYLGYQGKLTPTQEKIVKEYVDQNVVTQSQAVVSFIAQQFGITYSWDGVTKLLHRLGFTYKQIVAIPGKLDEAAQLAFLEKYHQMKAAQTADELILFGDGVHPTHNIQKTRAWIKKGTDKQIKTNTGRGRLNINGVMDPEKLEVTAMFSDTINAQTTIQLFDQIQERYANKKKITIIFDNARYYKNKDVTAYLAKPGCRLKLIFLPPYSPNLNYIERLWKFMKKYITGTKYRDKFKEFEADIHFFFDHISNYQEQLRSFIGAELHLVKLTQ